MPSTTFLHIIALICAAAIAIISVIDLRYKIGAICALTLIALIAELLTLFLNKTTPPVLDYSFKLKDSNYAEGVQVNGIAWEKNFKRYSFKLSSKPKRSEAYDVNVYIMFPVGFVTHELAYNKGCEQISFPQRSTSVYSTSKEGKMLDQIPFYSTVFYVNIIKMLPSSTLDVSLILNWPDYGITEEDYGIFNIEYKYKDSNNKEIVAENKFAFFISGPDSNEFVIDRSKPAGPEHKFGHKIIFKEPREIGDGFKIQSLGQLKPQGNDKE